MAFDFFKKITESLSKTRTQLMGSLAGIFSFGNKITDAVLNEVEDVLYTADIGVHATELLVGELRNRAVEINSGKIDPFMVLKETMLSLIARFGQGTKLLSGDARPHVILVVGVNGVGKTTTIGKLAMRFRNEGRSVLLAACDTFRAAAVEQLEIWAERAGAEFIKAHEGADPASVAFDSIMRAKARSTDVVIIDTAGRLHTSRNLMEELKKIRRVLGKADATAPHETLLVLDATNGQNALTQAEVFQRDLSITGIVLTKLDGTAKGGIVISIIDKLGVPIKLIGIGESIGDLRDFDPGAFIDALFMIDEKNGRMKSVSP
ncbi:signal recognition particle-docking protein FtsY [bacterium]|nr:signal recognition particle-docking protein FtsY [bacterium]